MDFSPPDSSVLGDSPGQEYWNRLPYPPPRDLLNPGIELRSPALQVDSLPSEPPGNTLPLNKNNLISSLSVLHNLEHTKRFTELGREEKGKVGDRGDLVEKKESQKGERAIRPVISLPSKNGY